MVTLVTLLALAYAIELSRPTIVAGYRAGGSAG